MTTWKQKEGRKVDEQPEKNSTMLTIWRTKI